jgi:hypothetical protein
MTTTAASGAGALLRTHGALLARLPPTFRAFVGLEAAKWPTLFAPEQAYLAALLEALAAQSPPETAARFAGLTRIETEAGCAGVRESDPRRLQDATQALLRRRGLLPRWREEVDLVFRGLQPALDARLHPPDAPRRVVVVVYGQGIAIQRDKLWARLSPRGKRVALRLDGAVAAEPFLRGLFALGPEATLFSALGGAGEAWTVDAGEALHSLCERPGGGAPVTGISYARLREYRESLARALYERVSKGVSGPQELAAYARGLDVAPPPGALLNANEVVRAFVREILLGGNGTLLVSNTFVEWAAAQALRRAEPRLLVARFGVRDKMKPFSSLLLFSSPRPTDRVPILEDPFGSFVDVEQLGYYVWLHAEKSAAYRGRTLYLFLAEGVDQMLVVRPGGPPAPAAPGEAGLPDVAATMGAWLGLAARPVAGRPLPSLL